MSIKHLNIARRSVAAGGIIAASFFAAALPALSADSAARNTRLDFSSNGFSWRLDCRQADGSPCATNTEYLKVPGDPGPGPILQHPDYPYEHNENKRIADTNNPILQPWVKQKMDAEVARVIGGGYPFIPTSRCWPGGVPGIFLYTGLHRRRRVQVCMAGEDATAFVHPLSDLSQAAGRAPAGGRGGGAGVAEHHRR